MEGESLSVLGKRGGGAVISGCDVLEGYLLGPPDMYHYGAMMSVLAIFVGNNQQWQSAGGAMHDPPCDWHEGNA